MIRVKVFSLRDKIMERKVSRSYQHSCAREKRDFTKRQSRNAGRLKIARCFNSGKL
jgi:hypothetical protein